MRILIVDNNVELCQVLENYFSKQQDLEVVGVAHNGEEALALIELQEPDVVLLDITMPYLDGIGVLERLETLNLQKRPKIIVISAFGSDSFLSQINTLKPDYYLVKPFRMEVLVARIRQFAGETSKNLTAVSLESEVIIETIEQKIVKLLHSLGIPPHYKGFSYLKEAVLLSANAGYFGGGLTKELYPSLAKKFNTTSGGVEAAIRNSVVVAWENGNSEAIKKLCEPHFPNRIPTNSLFIAKLIEKVQ